MALPTLQIVAREGKRPGHRLLTLIGPLTLETVSDFLRVIRADTSEAVIMDFSAVPFIDSAGVGAMVQSYVRFMNSKRRLAITGLNARVTAVLDITRVNKFFPIFPTVDEAEARFG
jgi:anti-anti-sigma factor